MGVRYFSEAHKLLRRMGGNLPQNYKGQVLWDSLASAGDQAQLDGATLWIDGSSFYRLGLNIGPTFQNLGAGDCKIDACQAPREYATQIKTDPNLEAIVEPMWQTLGTIATGESVGVDGKIWSLFRFTFSGLGGGEVNIMTL